MENNSRCYVVTDESGKTVSFCAVNASVPFPLKRDSINPERVWVELRYHHDFMDIIAKQGWNLHPCQKTE